MEMVSTAAATLANWEAHQDAPFTNRVRALSILASLDCDPRSIADQVVAFSLPALVVGLVVGQPLGHCRLAGGLLPFGLLLPPVVPPVGQLLHQLGALRDDCVLPAAVCFHCLHLRFMHTVHVLLAAH